MRRIRPLRGVLNWLSLTGMSIGEFLRFGVVGLTTNAAAYLIYLVLTSTGVAPAPAIAILYIYWVLQSFLLNRTWSYRDDGPPRPALVRYCVTYISRYVLNNLVLLVFVNAFHFDDKLVQGMFILVAGVSLYFVQKVWVFSKVQVRPGSGSTAMR